MRAQAYPAAQLYGHPSSPQPGLFADACTDARPPSHDALLGPAAAAHLAAAAAAAAAAATGTPSAGVAAPGSLAPPLSPGGGSPTQTARVGSSLGAPLSPLLSPSSPGRCTPQEMDRKSSRKEVP